jgi:hypothetical protein
MKTERKNNKLAELMALALMLPSVALAQGSGSHGGGEDGVFKSIRDEVGSWIKKNTELGQLESKLELKSISGATLQTSFEQAVKDVGEKVIFTHEEIQFGENSRICKNQYLTITCNINAWNNTRGDTRYMIVFHEYLGIAGIETNVETDYSRYPISSKILGFVKTKESFELGMDKTELNPGIEGIVRMVYKYDPTTVNIFAYEFVTKEGNFLLSDAERSIYASNGSWTLMQLLNRKVVLTGTKTIENTIKYGKLNVFVIEKSEILPETRLDGVIKNEWDFATSRFIKTLDGRYIYLKRASSNITLRRTNNRSCTVNGYFKKSRHWTNTFFVDEINCQ